MDRKIAPAELYQGPDFTAAVLDTVASLVVVLEVDGTVVRFNRACERLTGYAEEEILGRSFTTLIPARELRDVSGVFERLAAGSYPSQHRNRWVTKDGRERVIDWTNTAMLDERHEVRFVVGTGLDVTAEQEAVHERERAQAALRASEEKFRSVFEQAAIGMGRVCFSDARWIDVNDAFCRMLGYERDDLLGTPWPEITHPDDLDLDLVPFKQMAAGELESYSVEKRFVRRDGRLLWARLTLSLVTDLEGRPDYEIAVIEDIDVRKHAELALREANERLLDADRRKNEFMAMLSHELRNPLAPIRNSLHILGRVDPTSIQARRAVDVIDRQSRHMARLIDDLLDVTRISRGKIQLRRDALDLGALVRHTAEDHRTVFAASGIELAVDVDERPMIVHGDATRLAQVIGNLLGNAVKFTPRGGRVDLSVRVVEGVAEVRVKDSGAGIPPEVADRLFEPFFQVGQTLDRAKGGLGLGLALVRGLVELHGGSANAASDGLGRGAEMIIRLPLDEDEARPRDRGSHGLTPG